MTLIDWFTKLVELRIECVELLQPGVDDDDNDDDDEYWSEVVDEVGLIWRPRLSFN